MAEEVDLSLCAVHRSSFDCSYCRKKKIIKTNQNEIVINKQLHSRMWNIIKTHQIFKHFDRQSSNIFRNSFRKSGKCFSDTNFYEATVFRSIGTHVVHNKLKCNYFFLAIQNWSHNIFLFSLHFRKFLQENFSWNFSFINLSITNNNIPELQDILCTVYLF